MACLATYGLGVAARADTTWRGNTNSQDWTIASNWDNGVPLTASNNGAAYINTATAGKYPIYSSAGSTQTAFDVFVGNGSGASGQLDQTAGTLQVGNGSWMFVGAAGGTGTLNITTAATFNAGAINVGAWTGGTSNGTVTVNTNGKVNLTGGNARGNSYDASLLIGEGGGNNSGTFNLMAGEVNTSFSTVIGSFTTGTGTLDMSGGTFNNTGEFQVGRSAKGVLKQSGGTLNSTSYFVVGRENGSSGTVTLSNNGTINAATAAGFAVVGSFSGANGTLNVSGGNFKSTRSGGGLIIGEGGTGTLTVSGTGSVEIGTTNDFYMGANSGSSGTINLDGGTITGRAVTKGAGAGTINFNGGTLKAAVSTATFMGGLTAANVHNGTSTLDVGNGLAVTITQNLNHSALPGVNAVDGGFIKTGAGTLTLNNNNGFNGNLTINAGRVEGAQSRAANPTTGSLGSTTQAGRQIIVNNSGTVLALTAANVLGDGGTSTTPAVSLILNAGTRFETGSSTTTGGFWNLLPATTLNDSTVRIGSGANSTNFQGLALLGNVTVGGTTGSTIDNFASSLAGSNGVHLGGVGAAAGAKTTFTVTPTGSAATAGLTVSAPLINSAGNLNATGLIKAGPGTMALTAVSAYAGGTTINAGTLRASSATSSLGTGTTDVNGTSATVRGVLAGKGGGTGATGGAVNVNQFGTITAGSGATAADSVGTLSAGATTFNGGGAYAWKVADATAGKQPGTHWDLLSLTSLAVTATNANPFTIFLTSASNPNFVDGGVYKIATGTLSAFDMNAFVLNTDSLGGGYTPSQFTLSSTGSELDLTYNAIQPAPEPTTMALVALAAVPLLGRRKRRASTAD